MLDALALKKFRLRPGHEEVAIGKVTDGRVMSNRFSFFAIVASERSQTDLQYENWRSPVETDGRSEDKVLSNSAEEDAKMLGRQWRASNEVHRMNTTAEIDMGTTEPALRASRLGSMRKVTLRKRAQPCVWPPGADSEANLHLSLSARRPCISSRRSSFQVSR